MNINFKLRLFLLMVPAMAFVFGCAREGKKDQQIITAEKFVAFVKNGKVEDARHLLLDLAYMVKSEDTFDKDCKRMKQLFNDFGIPARKDLIIRSEDEASRNSLLFISFPIDIKKNMEAAESTGLLKAEVEFSFLRRGDPGKILKYTINADYKKSMIRIPGK